MNIPPAVQPWGRLLRLPNLLTVPGDPLAGCMLAWAAGFAPDSLWLALACAVASVLLYAAGLLMNDVFDLQEDRAERPARPLPAGEIAPSTAWCLAMILGGVAIGICAATGPLGLGIGLLLFGVILAYNGYLKRYSVGGAAAMGLCRALSMLLGVSVAGTGGLTSPLVITAAVTLWLYVAAVTLIADRETERVRIGIRRWAPLFCLLTGFAVIYSITPGMLGSLMDEPASYILTRMLALLCVIWVIRCTRRLAGTPAPSEVSATIGTMIRGLILFQAACASVLPWLGGFCALAILAAWPLNRRLSETYYSS
ncbi:MAG: UbiA family prenyltransferase [Verrucomicrobia bacterium]|nr:UbiA family prenyltransferase [Verrucomicrobiota bacterium]